MNPKRIPSRPPDPVDAEGFHTRGNRYSRTGSYESAIADYDKAIELDPNFADAHYDRGYSFYEMGRLDEAVKDLSRAIELNPDDDRYYALRSVVYLFSDHMDLAQIDEEMCEELRNRG